MLAKLRKIVGFLSAHPVVIFDLLKYGAAALLMFGIKLPDGFDVVAPGLALVLLSIASAKVVAAQKADALNTPVPGSPPEE